MALLKPFSHKLISQSALDKMRRQLVAKYLKSVGKMDADTTS